MKFVPEMLRLYAVTDRRWTRQGLAKDVEEALRGGVTMLQVREKNMTTPELAATGQVLLPLAHRYGVPLIIDDDVEAALLCSADGVHVGQNDESCRVARRRLGPKAIIGVSAQTVKQALAAQDAGADYLGVGAVFTTGTKDDADNVPLPVLATICRAVTIPVVAIGGIQIHNVEQLRGSGIAGIAVVSAIFAAENIKDAASNLRQVMMQITQNQQ